MFLFFAPELGLILNPGYFIGLAKSADNPTLSCTSLSACSGQLQWLDDGSEFVFDSSFMEDLIVQDTGAAHFFINGRYGIISTIAEPLHALCQAETTGCGTGECLLLTFGSIRAWCVTAPLNVRVQDTLSSLE